MRKTKIGIMALACLLLLSCGNLGALMSGEGVANAITSVIGLNKVLPQELLGTWSYGGPGCAFMSENLLAKADRLSRSCCPITSRWASRLIIR